VYRDQNVSTAPIGAANLLFNEVTPCKPKVFTASLIRLAYSRYEYASANIFDVSFLPQKQVTL
jgi:hypothetical protein